MSEEITAQIEELLEEAADLPDHGPEEIRLIEQAVRLADSHQLTDYSFHGRKRLMTAATFGGAPDVALIAFTWCVAQCDREPDRFDSAELLWEYKWVVSGLKQFPQISRAQIESAFEEMTRRYQQHGLSLRPIYKLRVFYAIHRGDREEARRWQKLWRQTDAGFGNDCSACECNDQVEYLIYVGKVERALELARPLLNGRLACAEIPHLTYAEMLLPFLKLGRVEEAAELQRQGLSLIRGNREFLSALGDHMTFLTLTGNDEAAQEVVCEGLGWALETRSPLRRFYYSKGAYFALRSAVRKGQGKLNLRLPREFPLFQDAGQYTAAELCDWFEADARRIAGLFDQRNGTSHFTDCITELDEYEQYATEFPID